MYEISEAEKHLLDRVEGLGSGYHEAQFQADVNGATLACFAYVAASSHLAPLLFPYDWYKPLVVEGARYHGFPEAYVDQLDSIECLSDPDTKRRLRKEDLLIRLRNYGR